MSTAPTARAIRPERPQDQPAIREVNERAFGQAGEADLVDALRRGAIPFLSFVAEEPGRIVGHICFSPVTIGEEPETRPGLGLGPMAVLPARQRQGIGSALVRHGLEECRRLGHGIVVLVGHPEYYPRFGFVPASRLGLSCEYEVPDEAFMVLELRPGSLARASGLVRYHPAFGEA